MGYQPVPQPTAAPSTHGVTSYLPISSQTNPLASNYHAPMSVANSSNQLNAYGAPLYSNNVWNTNNRVATTNPLTGAIISTAQTNTTPSTTTDTNPNTGTTQNDYSAELTNAINEYYNPAMETLNLRKSQYDTQLPVTQQRVTDMYTAALTPLNERLATGETNINTQRTDTSNAKDSAISQARQLYNELLQQGLSKFGGASSAGGAYAAIIGKQIAKNMGGIEQTNAQSNAKLDTEWKNLSDFVSQQKIDLDTKKRDALTQVQTDYDNAIKEIDIQKNTLESDKAAQRITALKEARDRAYAVQDAATAYQNQLDLFDKQTQATLANQYSLKSGISADAIATFTKLISAGVPAINAAQMSGIDSSLVQGIVTPSQLKYDAYGNLIDPNNPGTAISAPNPYTPSSINGAVSS